MAKRNHTWRNRIVGAAEVPPDQLLANPANFRRHPKEQQAALEGVISELGYLDPVLVQAGTDLVIDGHLRIELALRSGQTTIPVQYVDLTDDETRLALATFDPIAGMAFHDQVALDALLASVQTDDDGVRALLESLGGEVETIAEGLTDPDAVPGVPDEPVTKPGDLWRLGRHRLLCGDSTVVTDVERLMAGERADIVFTSPPYAEQRSYAGNVPPWDQLMQDVFSVLPAADGAQVLVNLGLVHKDGEWWPYWDGWIEWMRALGWRRFAWYVWDQGPGLPGDWNGRLAPSHEFIFHFNRVAERARKTKESKWAGTANHSSGLRGKDGFVKGYSHAGKPVQPFKVADSVFRVMRHKARGIEVNHPAVFPVELVAEVLAAFSDAGDVLYEPFTGSGTSFIAAEQCGRACFGMELTPQYVDIAVARWEQFTGQQATLDRAPDALAAD